MNAMRAVVSTSVFLAALASTSMSQGSFPIATTAQREMSIGVACDGVNFLVAFQGHTSSASPVFAQLVSPSGTLIGPPIQTGHSGGAPYVAYGAGAYLMVWEDDALSQNNDIWGVFISPAGVIGIPFAISTAATDETICGVDFSGTNFLVVYTAQGLVTPPRVKGRLVTTTGVVGAELAISSGFGDHGLDSVVLGGTMYLVVWVEDVGGTDVRGRFVDPGGLLGVEFSVNDSALPQNEFATVGWDGTNYLVCWEREPSSGVNGEWDLLAQRVSPTGTLVGGVIPVTTSAGAQFAPFVAFDGVNYLVSWTEATNDIDKDQACDADESTCWDVSARFLSPAGSLVGPLFSIVNDAGNQFASPLVWSGTRYLVVWDDGDNPWTGKVSDVYGKFVDPLACQPPAAYCTPKVNSLGCTPLITWSGVPSASNPAPFVVGTVNSINNKSGLLFYSVLGTQGAPFQGGYLCAKTPVKRTVVQTSGGNPPPNDCSGRYALDFNAHIASGKDPALLPGQPVWLQYWSRDPGYSPPDNTGLSNAIASTICP